MVITQPSHLNTGPFANLTTFDHLNTRLVQYSDGYCNIIWGRNTFNKLWLLLDLRAESDLRSTKFFVCNKKI